MLDNSKVCYIVGGGPSLTGFDFERLRGKTVIAVNYSLKYCPFATYFLSADSGVIVTAAQAGFWGCDSTTTKVAIIDQGHKRYKYAKPYLCAYDCTYEPTRIDGAISLDPNVFASGACSGFSALQFSVKAGFGCIHLLGIDCWAQSGRRHFYSEGNDSAAARRLDEFASYFIQASPLLKGFGVSVISHSSISVLNQTYPYSPLESL